MSIRPSSVNRSCPLCSTPCRSWSFSGSTNAPFSSSTRVMTRGEENPASESAIVFETVSIHRPYPWVMVARPFMERRPMLRHRRIHFEVCQHTASCGSQPAQHASVMATAGPCCLVGSNDAATPAGAIPITVRLLRVKLRPPMLCLHGT